MFAAVPGSSAPRRAVGVVGDPQTRIAVTMTEFTDGLETSPSSAWPAGSPGRETVHELWRNLCDGVESIRVFTDEELLAAGVDPAALDEPGYVKAGTMLDGAADFDAAFFGVNPREAEIIDPQHRLFLECAREALEHAGYDPRALSRADRRLRRQRP